MSTYLLLRNNKETGPFSKDQLVEMGLKPYDLVWEEGRSAAWRYPSEIPELKPHAPVVEEQPFDRFFKKPNEEQKEASSTTSTEKPPKSSLPGYTAESAERQVFVSNPVVKREKVGGKQAAKVVPPPAAAQHPPAEEKVVRLEKRFEQPIEEITDRYAKALIERKRKFSRKRQVGRALVRMTPFFIVLGLGVAIGLYLNRDKNGSSDAGKADYSYSNQNDGGQDLQLIPAVRTEHELDDATLENAAMDDSMQSLDDASVASGGNQGQHKSVSRNGENSRNKRSVAGGGQQDGAGSQPANTDPVSGERSKTVRTEEAGNAPAGGGDVMTFQDMMRRVYVSNNDYTRGTFGGIKDLEITVINDTRYLLDEVTVELQYLKPSEQPLKSETLRFTSVAPKGSSTIKLPDSQRGVKIAYRVIKVQSRQLSDDIARSS